MFHSERSALCGPQNRISHLTARDMACAKDPWAEAEARFAKALECTDNLQTMLGTMKTSAEAIHTTLATGDDAELAASNAKQSGPDHTNVQNEKENASRQHMTSAELFAEAEARFAKVLGCVDDYQTMLGEAKVLAKQLAGTKS